MVCESHQRRKLFAYGNLGGMRLGRVKNHQTSTTIKLLLGCKHKKHMRNDKTARIVSIELQW